MIRMKFTCTLLSDIILNQNAGSKEKQSTLDFIPGNVFLGIAASKLYGLLDPERSMAIFHSGKVRFGDAHPLYEGKRTLKIPAVLYWIFQYAPWNAKRQVPDADRCGIEKGSVFVINLNGGISPSESAYVGCYKNEGFGKVIYNPEFLKADDTGKSTLIFKEDKAKEGTNSEANADLDTYKSALNQPLMQRLMSLNATKCNIYDIVNEFVSKNARNFRQDNERFASQWSYIRNLADSSSGFQNFKDKLKEYLERGVASEKWQFKKKDLYDFVNSLESKKENNVETNKKAIYWREIMTNLSSEMAKKCK